MAKKQKLPQPAPAPAPKYEAPVAALPVEPTPAYGPGDLRFWLQSFKGQAIIVSLLALIIYFNTFNHEFAHDDGIVIVKNEFVLEGFGGFKGILTKDAYHSYYRQLNTTNQLKGGRFRPLSILSFAAEQQFLGAVKEEDVDSVLRQQISYGVAGPSQKKLISDMHVRHVFNVLWYMLSVVVLLYFLRYIMFGKYPVVALIAAVLFTVHPVHTEVVANVKSRDEIMSLLFMCLTFICAFKYEENHKRYGMLAAGMLSYLLAFLSKEYAITVLALLPLALVVFRGFSVYKALTATLPYVAIVPVYLALRLNAISTPLEENTELSASAVSLISAFPWIAIILGGGAMYLYTRQAKTVKTESATFVSKLLPFLPYLLIGGAAIQAQFSALPEVIESAAKEVLNNPYLFADEAQKKATIISSSLYYVKFLFFPHPLSADYSFAQIPYKDFSHPSVALSIIVHLGLLLMIFLFLPKKNLSASALGGKVEITGKHILCFSAAFYMIHLLMINNMVFDIGATLGERLIYHSSVGFVAIIAWLLYKGAERIQPAKTGMTLLAAVVIIVTGLMSFKTIDRNKAWKNDSTLFGTDIETVPNSVLVNANVAASYITLADYAETPQRKEQYLRDAVRILDHTLSIHRKFVAAFLNRGIAWYKLGDIDKTIANIDTVRQLYPTYPTLPGMYKLICDFYLREGWEKYGKVGRYQEAIATYQKGLQVDPNNADLWYNMGGAYYTNRQPKEAIDAFRKTLQLQPGNKNAEAGITAAMQMLNGSPAPQK